MAKLLTTTIMTPIQTTDKSACLTLLQTIFAAIKAEHS